MKYENGKIYKLVCNVTGLVYIGSTIQPLYKRSHEHKRKYPIYLKTGQKYMTSFKIVENGNFDIVLIETYPCSNKEQLHARERYWIEKTECVNKVIPTRTHKEWRDDNKDYIKNYQVKNKELVNKINKKYRDANKQKLNENKQKYYNANKEVINSKRRMVVECECGSKVVNGGLYAHKLTPKHQELLQNKISNVNIDA